MKSLLISGHYFPPQVGGISRYMASVASILGPERVCCLTRATGMNNGSDLESRIKVYRRPLAFAESNLIQAFGWGAAISEIVLRERPRVAQIASVAEGYMGLWLRRWLKMPFVVFAYGNEILEAMHDPQWNKPKLALQQAHSVLAISRFTASLVENMEVDPKKINVVSPGCDIDRFRPRPKDDALRAKLLGANRDDRIVLTTGGLVERKGHDMVIRSLPSVCKSIPVTYVIIGEGPYRKELEKLAFEVGVRDRVRFLGRVSDAELPSIMSLCDVFIMPSRDRKEICDVEGFGIVFLEANACGKPVIGGRSGGISDAIVDGVTGFLVNPTDPQDIARRLLQVLADGGLASKMGERGRARVVSDFTWKRAVDQVYEVLQDVCAEGPPRDGGLTASCQS